MTRIDGTTDIRQEGGARNDGGRHDGVQQQDAELAPSELKELWELLNSRRRHDIAEAQRLAESLGAVLAARSDATADDEHDPEGPTLSSEWSRLQGLRGQSADDIAAVDAAFVRMRTGTYGVCVRCTGPIGVDRLRARPTAELCISCALTVDS